MSRFLAILTCCTLLALPQLALACPGCKDNLTEHHVNAYGWSIIFMMSMPFLILGSLSAYFYYEVRKARKLQQSAPEGAATWVEASSQATGASR